MEIINMLLTTCLVLSSASALADVKPPDEVSLGLAQIAKSRYQALEIEVKKDPRAASEVAAYRVAVKSVLKKSLPDSERDRQLVALGKKIEPLMQTLFKRAGIDEKAYKDEGERHIKRMAAKQRRQYSARYLGYLGWYWKLYPYPKPAPKPADKEIALSAPFPLEQQTDNGDGDLIVDKEEGRYQASARVLMVGGHDNSAGLAHFFEVDDNYDKIQAFAALPETGWRVFAFAELFGVFGASAKSRIEIFSNNEIICSEEVEHGNVLAPVISIVTRDGIDNVVTNCEINSPDQGDEIVIRATSIAGAWGGIAGSASSQVRATPRDLRLLLKY